MAARSIGSLTISFGMVSIPIRLVPAVRKKSISFNQIDDQTMSRVRYRKVSEATGEEVQSNQASAATHVRRHITATRVRIRPMECAKCSTINVAFAAT